MNGQTAQICGRPFGIPGQIRGAHAGQNGHAEYQGRRLPGGKGLVPALHRGFGHGPAAQGMNGQHVRTHARGLGNGTLHGIGDVHEFEIEKNGKAHVLEPAHQA